MYLQAVVVVPCVVVVVGPVYGVVVGGGVVFGRGAPPSVALITSAILSPQKDLVKSSKSKAQMNTPPKFSCMAYCVCKSTMTFVGMTSIDNSTKKIVRIKFIDYSTNTLMG